MKMKLNALIFVLSYIQVFQTSYGEKSGGSLNILLSNDDGFETENIQSLFEALDQAGHNVIMSAPYSGQSGTSGALALLRPILPTSAPSPKGTISEGAPGVGPTGLHEKQYYVDGFPTSAVLYGIDILAPKYFGSAPDLVVMGPNEGNNVGLITPHSGTVGGAVAAINHGIPAIAISGPLIDESNPGESNATTLAALGMKVIEEINTRYGIDLPPGSGLNVNIGGTIYESADEYKFELTEVGVANFIGFNFVEKLGEDPLALAFGIPPGLPYPGLSFTIPYTDGGYPEDKNRKSEGNVFADGTVIEANGIVTISPIQGTYKADEEVSYHVEKRLKYLFKGTSGKRSKGKNRRLKRNYLN